MNGCVLMLLVISIVLAFGFAIAFGKPLKKCPYFFYFAAIAVSAAAACMNFRGLPPFVNTYIAGLFTRGAFATGLWCVVMWTGAMPGGSKAMKKLMPVRGELSIFAAILTLGHNIGFGRTYFVRLFTEPDKLGTPQLAASIITIVMLVIMIPLTVLSFPQIRRKMKASLWKKIQRTAYIFYALIYIHVMVLFVPGAKAGRDGYYFSIVVYSAVFLGYAVCRLRKAYFQSKKRNHGEYNKRLADGICIAAFVAVIAVPCCAAAQKNENTEIPAQESVPVSVTETLYEIPVTDSAETSVQSAVTDVTVSETLLTETSVSAVTEISGEVTSDVTETAATEKNAEENNEDKTEENREEPAAEQPQEQEQQAPEPEIQYVYNNGTYTASAYGYDGDVTVTITIENDVIVSISGSTAESDASYFNDASGYVFGQITGTVNPNVNAYGGCTYSSNGIMNAVAQALNQARR